MNARGQVIKTFTQLHGTHIILDAPALPGFYFLKIMVDRKTITKKIILN
jgi:hypothetical protein